MPRKHNHQHRAAHRRYLATDAALYISPSAAVKYCRVSRQTIYNWIEAGKVQTTHIAGRRVIIRASLTDKRASSSPSAEPNK